jgi:glutathione peroxidase
MKLLSSLRSQVTLGARKVPSHDIYTNVVSLIDGGQLELESRRGHPTLIVNTACRCGYSSQLNGLQGLFARYRDSGLLVLGCPSGDFGHEAESDAEIIDICQREHGVEFPLAKPASVRFTPTKLWHDLASQPNAGPPGWNFTKYLVGADGDVVFWCGTNVRPDSWRVTEQIEAALGVS